LYLNYSCIICLFETDCQVRALLCNELDGYEDDDDEDAEDGHEMADASWNSGQQVDAENKDEHRWLTNLSLIS